MSRRRKTTQYHSGWMLSVVFNSLLILMPVIAARTITAAYAGAGFAETPNVEAVLNTRRRIEAAFVDMAPRNADEQFRQWNERITDALAARDTSTLRGLLLAAPQLLGKERGGQIELRASAEAQGTRDERLIRAALTILPMELAADIAAAAKPAGEVAPTPLAPAPASGDLAAPAETTDESGMISAADRLSASPNPDRRFQMLGSYNDLATLSERWLNNARQDNLVVKLTGFGLVLLDKDVTQSDAVARAASIVKSAERSDRLSESFRAHIEARADLAVPTDPLEAGLKAAFADFVTSDVRGERVHDAFLNAVNLSGAVALQKELVQIDRIATLTSPTGALTLIQKVQDGTDLRRARLLAEAGGDRAIALIKFGGPDALRTADAGIRWTRNMILEVMSLTAAGMVLFWVMLSALRFYIRKPRPKELHVV